MLLAMASQREAAENRTRLTDSSHHPPQWTLRRCVTIVVQLLETYAFSIHISPPWKPLNSHGLVDGGSMKK